MSLINVRTEKQEKQGSKKQGAECCFSASDPRISKFGRVVHPVKCTLTPPFSCDPETEPDPVIMYHAKEQDHATKMDLTPSPRDPITPVSSQFVLCAYLASVFESKWRTSIVPRFMFAKLGSAPRRNRPISDTGTYPKARRSASTC